MDKEQVRRRREEKRKLKIAEKEGEKKSKLCGTPSTVLVPPTPQSAKPHNLAGKYFYEMEKKGKDIRWYRGVIGGVVLEGQSFFNPEERRMHVKFKNREGCKLPPFRSASYLRDSQKPNHLKGASYFEEHESGISKNGKILKKKRLFKAEVTSSAGTSEKGTTSYFIKYSNGYRTKLSRKRVEKNLLERSVKPKGLSICNSDEYVFGKALKSLECEHARALRILEQETKKGEKRRAKEAKEEKGLAAKKTENVKRKEKEEEIEFPTPKPLKKKSKFAVPSTNPKKLTPSSVYETPRPNAAREWKFRNPSPTLRPIPTPLRSTMSKVPGSMESTSSLMGDSRRWSGSGNDNNKKRGNANGAGYTGSGTNEMGLLPRRELRFPLRKQPSEMKSKSMKRTNCLTDMSCPKCKSVLQYTKAKSLCKYYTCDKCNLRRDNGYVFTCVNEDCDFDICEVCVDPSLIGLKIDVDGSMAGMVAQAENKGVGEMEGLAGGSITGGEKKNLAAKFASPASAAEFASPIHILHSQDSCDEGLTTLSKSNVDLIQLVDVNNNDPCITPGDKNEKKIDGTPKIHSSRLTPEVLSKVILPESIATVNAVLVDVKEEVPGVPFQKGDKTDELQVLLGGRSPSHFPCTPTSSKRRNGKESEIQTSRPRKRALKKKRNYSSVKNFDDNDDVPKLHQAKRRRRLKAEFLRERVEKPTVAATINFASNSNSISSSSTSGANSLAIDKNSVRRSVEKERDNKPNLVESSQQIVKNSKKKVIDDVQRRWPWRLDEINKLHETLRYGNIPRSTVVYGWRCARKADVVQDVLEALGRTFAFVDCALLDTPAELYHMIVEQLDRSIRDDDSKENGLLVSRHNCSNPNDFVQTLAKLMREYQLQHVRKWQERNRSENIATPLNQKGAAATPQSISGKLSEYEKARIANIQENAKFLETLFPAHEKALFDDEKNGEMQKDHSCNTTCTPQLPSRMSVSTPKLKSAEKSKERDIHSSSKYNTNTFYQDDLENYLATVPPFHIVVDCAEKLSAWSECVLDRLPDLLRDFAVHVITLTSEPFPLYRGHQGEGEGMPFRILFGRLSQPQMLQALHADRPDGVSSKMYFQYVQTLYAVFKDACEDLAELRYLARFFFDTAFKDSVLISKKKLRKSFQDHRKKLFTHDVDVTVISTSTNRDEGMSLETELPELAKFVLLAAYACSYNPKDTDNDYFSNEASRQKRKSKRRNLTHGSGYTAGKKKRNGRLADVPFRLYGPSAFPLERLLHNLFYILQAHWGDRFKTYHQSHAAMTQVNSLVELRLLQRVSASDDYVNPRYKCTTERDEIAKIAESVGFNLDKYLYDSG
eukprot:g3073.t1